VSKDPAAAAKKTRPFADDAAGVLAAQDPTLDRHAVAMEIAERHAAHLDLDRAIQETAVAHGLVSHGEMKYRADRGGNETRIRWGPDGLFRVGISFDKKGAEVRTEIAVIADAVRPVRRIQIEEDVYVQVGILEGQTVTDTVPGVLARLDLQGRVLSHGDARDLFPTWLHRLIPKAESGFPTWGFYPDRTGRIVECRKPTPVKPDQEEAWSDVAASVDAPLTAEGLRAYATLFEFYHPREYLPVLGCAVAAPFAYIVRCERELVPHVYLYSRLSGLGKSSLVEALSDDLFGISVASGSTFNTPYRYAALVDSYCGPRAINEAERTTDAGRNSLTLLEEKRLLT
jgi:hypothetical protein